MTDSSTSPAPTPESLVFAAHHRPMLQSGNYDIEIKHTIQSKGEPKKAEPKIPLKTFTTKQIFQVEGERFHLKPDDIQAVFPPKGSLGDHSNILPHIILTHSTLPWERSPIRDQVSLTGSTQPWLVLLVFSEAEKPEITPDITLGDLSEQAPQFPPVNLNSHQKASDLVSVIDVERQVVEPLLPNLEELEMLAHVRRLQFSADVTKDMSRGDLHDSERAVIIANRLPEPGATTIVHLVSVEGRYDKATQKFDFQNALPTDKIRLVSLTNWRFACIPQGKTFAAMIQGLEQNNQSFHLPNSSNADAQRFLIEGFIPTRHTLRQGGKTLSWYRGPFATGPVNETTPLPAHTSDALLRYHSDIGMFDVSYASAWELGRLMTLQSPTFSTNLYDWKRLRDQQDKCRQRPEQSQHPLETPSTSTEMPESIQIWLTELSLLKGVPFKYLVPDERLLPKESIRFFQLDSNWIRCLLDGAYSIGRITTTDFKYDKNTQLPLGYDQATGILIRSDIVSGYPGLLIDAYSELFLFSIIGLDFMVTLNKENLSKELRQKFLKQGFSLSNNSIDLTVEVIDHQWQIHDYDQAKIYTIIKEDKALKIYKTTPLIELRRQNLSPNILLCIFKGELGRLDIHQKPEMLHFALEVIDHTYHRVLRDGSSLAPRPLLEKRLIPISQLAHDIRQILKIDEEKFNSGYFAKQMIETSEKVSFYRTWDKKT